MANFFYWIFKFTGAYKIISGVHAAGDDPAGSFYSQSHSTGRKHYQYHPPR
jgi:hypothetical protein